MDIEESVFEKKGEVISLGFFFLNWVWYTYGLGGKEGRRPGGGEEEKYGPVSE